MGDSEAVVAQTSTVMGYNAHAGHSSTDYGTSSAAVPDALGCEIVDSGNLASSTTKAAADALADNSNSRNESTHVIHSDSLAEEPPANTTYKASPPIGAISVSVTDPGLDAVSAEVSQVSGNWDVAIEATHLTSNENGIAQENVGGFTAEQNFEVGSAISATEVRLWSTVRANSLDFNAWTSLIEETEKVVENMSKIRRVYDAFLAEFPLCYGYWKKYADHEARLGSMENVVQVYEQAVQRVTYSVDIWLHYCIFFISTHADPEAIRRLFERGLAYVGTDYLSYSLWDKLIEYEYTLQEWSRLAVIYTRILENPNQQLDRYLNSFKELAVNRPLSELRTAEEAAEAASLLKAGGQEIEGDVHQDSLDQLPTPASTGLTEVEELEKYIGIRDELYKKTKEFDYKIVAFETAIRRPYFHVRPLNVAELENWHNYLDFIEEEADMSKIVKLYERCLIACANYPEYWIRYVICTETSGNTDLANNALARATQVFVKRQPEIHLFAARYKEHNEDLPGARASYQFLHSISPGLFEAIVKHANLEHRLGNLEDAVSVYEQAIAIEKGKEHSQTLSMLFAQYSRFVYLVLGDAEKAKDILTGALEHLQPSKPILESLIYLESSQSLPKRIEYIDSLVEKLLVHDLGTTMPTSTAEREEISCIFLEFVDQFGDVQSIKKAYKRHAKHFLCRRSTSEYGKRHAEDYLTSEKTKLAKSYSISQENGQSVMGAYPAAQNQWETGYGSQPQSWPPTVQAQGQQWIAGYSQQGAYSSYGSTYSNPQLSPLVPQAAAYSSYPQTYPVQQTFPQQSYAQPAAVTYAAPVPVPQPTSVPHGYYGSYY